ncbi:MAG: PorV/PorQ family protein [Ignavibacteriaceae bacterium]|nr:PorV/PorQ family protein [Ignavibacteriaceae bacterium]
MNRLLLIFLIAGSALHAQTAGNTGLAFLKYGFGARNIAMGDAGSVISNDVSALFYNPANLAFTQGTEFLFMHNEWIQDVRSEVFGAKTEIFGIPFAAGFNVTTVSDIPVRTKPGPADATFSANYFFGSISGAYAVSQNLSAGATIKYLYEGLLDNESTGIGFDLGASYRLNESGLTSAVSVKNLGSMNKLRNEETKLPAEIRVGVFYPYTLPEMKIDVITAAEYQKYISTDDNHFNFGAEIKYNNLVALRGGYQTGWISRGLTAGFGLSWADLSFDFAYLPFKLGLGNASLFSLHYKF